MLFGQGCRRTRLRSLRWIEDLEPRRLLSNVFPTNNEQYLLELINRARANPSAEALGFGISLNEGPPQTTISSAAKQPLAFNLAIIDAARQHSQEMLDADYFGHNGLNNSQPWDRMATAGYATAGTFGAGENIAWTGTSGAPPDQTVATAQLHQDLFVDSGIAGRGHRVNLMDPTFKEAGVGVLSGGFTEQGTTYNAVMITEDFGDRPNTVFITGVAYNDNITDDNFYTPGEGLGGLTITATGGSTFTTTTFGTGGYTLAVPVGTYTLTASGPGLSAPITFNSVVVGTDNVKRDFVPAPDATPPTAALNTPVTITGGTTFATFTVTYSDNVGIDVSSINANDVVVVGPDSVSRPVTLVSINLNSNGTPRTATYRLAAPGGTWDTADNGVYTVNMQPNQVQDTASNAVVAATLGSFTVNIADTTPPTASLNAPTVTLAGGTTATFTVTYSDNVGIDISTLDANDVQVTAPGGGGISVSLISVNLNSNGTPRTATYRIGAPGGTWDFADNGSYAISMQPQQVKDLGGNAVAAGAMGNLLVSIPDTTPPAASSLVAPDVAAAGAAFSTFTITYADNLAVNVASLDAADLMVVGPDSVSRPVVFDHVDINSNGTPRVATYRFNAPGGAWDGADNGLYTVNLQANQVRDTSNNPASATTLGTFTVIIPDTTSPTTTALATANITVAGGATASFTVTFADNVAINVASLGDDDITVTGPGGTPQNAVFDQVNIANNGTPRTATYHIAAPGSAWKLADNGTYTLHLNADAVTDTSSNAVAEGILGTFSVNIPLPDTTAPTRKLTAANVTKTGGKLYAFTVVYSDTTAVKASTLSTGDIQVVGPRGFKQIAKLISRTPSTNAAKITAKYSIVPPGGKWSATGAGTYTISIRTKEVSDTSNNFILAGTLGTFKVIFSKARRP